MPFLVAVDIESSVAGDNKRGPRCRPPEQSGHVLNFSVPHPFENTLFLGVRHRPKRHLGIKSVSFQVLEGGLEGWTSTSVYPRICHTLRCSDCCFFAAGCVYVTRCAVTPLPTPHTKNQIYVTRCAVTLPKKNGPNSIQTDNTARCTHHTRMPGGGLSIRNGPNSTYIQ